MSKNCVSFEKICFHKRFYLIWWKRQNKNMFLPKLKTCYFAITSFDLWMSKGTHDVFALMINFLGGMDLQPIEANETKGHVLAINLIQLLGHYNLRKKIIH
jgi:hypothetical protein